ncbi:MAG: 3-oxoacyl-ACP reductase FabG [Clostridia bacterium]|nr:3-oxoacyl-ACP reductase FabG [Clostridia bacterium]
MKKTVLINGGSRGIGRAICERLAKEGANVAFTYLHSEEKAKELAEKLGALAIRADSRVSSEVNRAVKAAEEKFGRIDILVNCAAKSEFALVTDISDEAWRDMMAVNLDGYFYYIRAVLPSMIREKQGRIINITSMWGEVGASCEVHYSASKAAVIGLTEALAKELGPSGITVNCVSPGVIDTDMNRAHLTEEDLSALADETPLGRIGTPEEVAASVAFLAGDGGNFITGQILSVNGGLVI